MKKYWKALVNLAIAMMIFLAVIFIVPKLLIFFAPFVVGWVIALIAAPFVRFFEEKVKLKRKLGSAFVIVLVIGLVVLVLYLIGAKLLDEGIDLVSSLPEIWESMEKDFADISRNLSVVYRRLPVDVQNTLTDMGAQIGSYMGNIISQIGTPAIETAGNFAKQLPSIIIGIIMALLSSYFFVAERNVLGEWFRKNMPQSIQSRYRMMRNGMVRAVGGYLKAQLKIEVWMYLLLVVGLSILKVEYVLLIALGIAFLDLLPFFGTGTVMVPWAIVKILSSDYKVAIGLLIIWGVGQLARQLIQPKIVGDSIGVPPIPTLFLLFIGYKLGGVIGMIVSVPIGLIAYTMYEEGAFDTTKNSVLILVSGLNHFRRLEPEDMPEKVLETTQETSQKTDREANQGKGQEEKHAQH